MAEVGTVGFRDPLESRFWTVVPPHYRQMLLVPPNLCAYASSVGHNAFPLRAGLFGMAINAGQAARYDVRRAREYCDSLREDIAHGAWSSEALYILRPDLLPQMKAEAGATLACTMVDGFGVCMKADSVARWNGSFDVARSRLPPVNEVMRFRTALEQIYRDVLARHQQTTPGPVERRLEGLLLFLAYRMEGCEAREAEERALSRLMGRSAGAFCDAPAVDHTLPPADQTHAFAGALAATLGATPDGGEHLSAVDAEGEAVWLQEYIQERLRGISESDARERVLGRIRQLAP
jgi:hypothetical protein